MDYFEAISHFIKEYPYLQQTAFLVGGIILGYLLRIIAVKLHIWRLSKQTRNRNMILIQSRKRKTEMKKDGSVRYFQYIKNAQYPLNEQPKIKSKE